MSERAAIFVFPPREGAKQTWKGWQGWRAVILSSTPGVAWEDERAGDAHEAAEVGLFPPFEPGLWIWRGSVEHPVSETSEGVITDEEPEFVGEWHRPSAEELAELAGPLVRRPSIRPPGAP
jgi:hypothetical protein